MSTKYVKQFHPKIPLKTKLAEIMPQSQIQQCLFKLKFDFIEVLRKHEM